MPVSRQSVRSGAILLITLAAIVGAHAAADLRVGSQSGLPLPRFVSLKADRVNVRSGPTRDNDVTWVYTHAGLPVEITAEYGNWRRIRDWEGAEGWVYHSLLSGKRTAMVMTKRKGAFVPLYDEADSHGAVSARLESGVLATIKQCTGSWCHISGSNFDGWIEQNRVWDKRPRPDSARYSRKSCWR
jgi:SH3-like domain-containing protein